MTLTSKLDQK